MQIDRRWHRIAALVALVTMAVVATLSLASCSRPGGPTPGGGTSGTGSEVTGAATGTAGGEEGSTQGDRISLTWYGQSMFKLATSDKTVVTDPFGRELGYPVPNVSANVVTVSHEHFDHNNTAAVGGSPAIVRGNGPHRAAGIEFVGIPSFHDERRGRLRGGNTLFRFKLGGVTFAHLGDLGQRSLSPAQAAALRGTQVLFIPIGGGNTISAATAARVARLVRPRIVVPMHYSTSAVGAGMATVDGITRLFPDRVKMLPASTEIDPADLPASTEVWVLQYGK